MGCKRAAMGHPEPFGLEYLGIGNEDLIDDVFKNRFQQIFDAVKAAYPDIVVVGTVGPAPSGQDYEEGWKYAREAGLPIVDEHSYQSSSWWFHNLDHYDHTDRKGPKVYLGEYGSWNTQLINGLSEAAFMGRMELNGDVVAMASYAPLFAKNGHHSWNPDLIYFDNERAYHPYSYWVQQMYATTTADTAWPSPSKAVHAAPHPAGHRETAHRGQRPKPISTISPSPPHPGRRLISATWPTMAEPSTPPSICTLIPTVSTLPSSITRDDGAWTSSVAISTARTTTSSHLVEDTACAWSATAPPTRLPAPKSP